MVVSRMKTGETPNFSSYRVGTVKSVCLHGIVLPIIRRTLVDDLGVKRFRLCLRLYVVNVKMVKIFTLDRKFRLSRFGISPTQVHVYTSWSSIQLIVY